MPAPTRKPVQRKSYGQQPIDHLFGDYRVLRVMSRGSLGTLHVAEDTTTGHVVLLRVLPRKLTALPRIAQTLEQDLAKLERVDHRNVTRVQARGRHDGRLFYVLDFPSSLTLMDCVRDRGVLRGLELLWLAAGMCSGLAALHAAGLAHGNLWPAKIGLSRLGPVLVDLSWSARLRGSTPDPHADLDALAATLVYAATAKLPGEAGGLHSTTLQLPESVPGPVLRLLEAIAQPRDRRPPAADLADDLQAQIDELLLEGSGPLEPLYERLDALSEALPGLDDPREESGGVPLPSGFHELLGDATVLDPLDAAPQAVSPPLAKPAPPRPGGAVPRTRAGSELAQPFPPEDPAPAKQGTTENQPPPRPRPRPRPRRSSGRDKASSPPNVHHLRPGLAVQQIRLLGEGGMGVVHLVRDSILQRQAALKLVRGASSIRLSRFQRETSVTARLDHPSIPPVFEAGTTLDDEPYLLMRFVDGESLSEILARRDAEHTGFEAEVQTRQLLQALIKVGEAVSFAHSRRIVHRDLKPANVMVGAFGEVFVMDWGLARDLSESAEEDMRARSELANDHDEQRPNVQGLTQEGTILGTPGYMAPEQARGEDVDAQADVFALGAILCEILTGKPPFTGPTPLAVLGLNRAGEVEYPRQRYRDVNLELDAISRKALAPETEDRYQTTEEFVADLRAFVDGRAVSVYDYNRVERFGRFTRRHPSLVSAALASLLLITGVPYAVYRARVSEVYAAIDEAQAALNQGEADRAAVLFDRAIQLDEDNHLAHLGLREARDLQTQTLKQENLLRAEALIDQGNAKLARGDLEGARTDFIRARDFKHPDAFGLVIQVEQAIDEDRTQEEARAVQLLKEQEAQKHRARGILLVERGDYEAAQAEFFKAIGFGLEQAERDLRDVEARLLAQREAEQLEERQLKSRRLTGQAERLLNDKPSLDDLDQARRLLIQAIGWYGKNERAQAGLLRIDRLIQRVDERRRQQQRERAAGKELGVARRSTRLAREQVSGNFDPDAVRKTFLDAMSAYDRAQYLLPDHSGIQRERAEVARDFARHLIRWGQQDLATYFLESSGIDPEDAENPVTPPRDEVLEVVEAQLAQIRRAFGGGSVRVQPTPSFDGLRAYLNGLGKRYRVEIEVRSETTTDAPPKVLATGLWVKVTDTETNTVYPTTQVMFEDGPYNRPVMVTESGHRLITPWNRAHNLDEARYVAEVERVVRQQLGKAKGKEN